MITKISNDFSSIDFKSGELILVDKPPGWTSFKVVRKIKMAVGIKKVGHSGTLDPMATGLLIVGTGKKTKELNEYQNLDKTYEGIIELGKSSPSMDTETEVTCHDIPAAVNENRIMKIREKFVGSIEQVPPMYSALKVDGQKLYRIARKGGTIDRKPRTVIIKEFDILKIDIPKVYFRITCSKGTYVRVIANDFGRELGTFGILSKLVRTRIGDFSIEDAIGISDFEKKMSEQSRVKNY